MIAKTRIESNLKQIDTLYNKARNFKHALYYSKLAILELCGWVEISMDDIVRNCARRHLNRVENVKLVEQVVIDKTYGFDYRSHFRDMLINVLGIIKVEWIEANVDPVKHDILRSTLGDLRVRRDSVAHTYVVGITPTLAAPSWTRARFYPVYDGLKDIESCVRGIKF